jgi:hypothetical protein
VGLGALGGLCWAGRDRDAHGMTHHAAAGVAEPVDSRGSSLVGDVDRRAIRANHHGGATTNAASPEGRSHGLRTTDQPGAAIERHRRHWGNRGEERKGGNREQGRCKSVSPSATHGPGAPCAFTTVCGTSCLNRAQPHYEGDGGAQRDPGG